MNLAKRLIGTGRRRIVTLSILALVVLCAALMFWLDHEPEPFDVVARAQERAESQGHEPVTGYVTAATLAEVMEVLLNKRGGYLNNDVLPPFSLLDNIPNWETGVIIQARDLARTLRNDFSRSQTQSGEDPDLAIADPQFSFDYSSWLLPSMWLLKVTPCSSSLRNWASDITWKPPLSVRIGPSQAMKRCSPPSFATRSAPGRSIRW